MKICCRPNFTADHTLLEDISLVKLDRHLFEFPKVLLTKLCIRAVIK